MTEEAVTLRSSIKGSLTRAALVRGTVFGSIGIAMFSYAAIWMNREQLSQWGWLYFFGGLTLITLGLRPYRKLTSLELNPYELRVDATDLQFRHKNKTYFSLPVTLLKELTYEAEGTRYGIKAQIEKSEGKKICVHNESFDMQNYLKENQRRHSADLFFPYFSQRSYERLKDLTEQCHACE